MKENWNNWDINKKEFYDAVKKRHAEVEDILDHTDCNYRDFNQWYSQKYDWTFLRNVLGNRQETGLPWDYLSLIHLPKINGEVLKGDLDLGNFMYGSLIAGPGLFVQKVEDPEHPGENKFKVIVGLDADIDETKNFGYLYWTKNTEGKIEYKWNENVTWFDEVDNAICTNDKRIFQPITSDIPSYDLQTFGFKIGNLNYQLITRPSGIKSYVIHASENPAFNTTDAIVHIGSIKTTAGEVVSADDIEVGCSIYITELDVPDRWYTGDNNFHILETEKLCYIVNVTDHETLGDYEVPTLTDTDVENLYNATVAGKTAVIHFDPDGAGETKDFIVTQCENITDKAIKFNFNDILLTYTIGE